MVIIDTSIKAWEFGLAFCQDWDKNNYLHIRVKVYMTLGRMFAIQETLSTVFVLSGILIRMTSLYTLLFY